MKPYNKENQSKSEEVREMFNNIAPTYDKLNHILSLNIDKIWRANVVRIARQASPKQLLDVATGTGDLAIALAKGCSSAQSIIGLDPSQGMLDVADKKIERLALKSKISLQCGSAESLDLPSASIDVVTVAFGVRNFGNLEQGLREMIRTLRPGGTLIVLEFSVCENWFIGPLYRLYSKWIMPRVGALLSRDRKAYDYLPESIEEFERPAQFLSLMERCSLKGCYARPQFFGVAQIYVGQK